MVIVHPIKTNTLIRSFNLGRVGGDPSVWPERGRGKRLGEEAREEKEGSPR